LCVSTPMVTVVTTGSMAGMMVMGLLLAGRRIGGTVGRAGGQDCEEALVWATLL